MAVARVPRARLEITPQTLRTACDCVPVELRERRHAGPHFGFEVCLRTIPIRPTEAVDAVRRHRDRLDRSHVEDTCDRGGVRCCAFGRQLGDLGEVLLDQPQFARRRGVEEKDDLTGRNALHLPESVFEVCPVVDGQRGHRRVECSVGEGQGLGDGTYRRRSTLGALAQHRDRRVDGKDFAVLRLVASGSGTDVEDSTGTGQCRVDPGRDARVGATGRRVRATDRVITGHGNSRSSDTISIAVSAASSPLCPSLPPSRSSACSRVSTVSTPKITGTPVSSAARVMPAAASLATNSKCGVSPRTTAPRHTTASTAPEAAKRFATNGNSYAPGTHATATSAASCLRSIASAPSSSFSVMSRLKRATATPKRMPVASSSPSRTAYSPN